MQKKFVHFIIVGSGFFGGFFIGFLMAWFRYTSIYEFSEKYKLRIGNLPWKLSVFFTDMKVLLCMKSNSEWSVYLRSRSSTWMGSEMIWSAVIMVISGLVRFIASLANGDILKPYTSDQKSTEDFLNLNDHSMIHLRNTGSVNSYWCISEENFFMI